MLNTAFDLKWAQTLDGQLCDDSFASQWISGPEELTRTHALRAQYDAVLVGTNTFLKDLCQLTVRLAPLPAGRLQPVRIILDRGGRIAQAIESSSRGAEIRVALATRERPTVIVTDVETARGIFPMNVHIVRSRLDFSGTRDSVIADLNGVMSKIEGISGRPIRQVMVEGGAHLLTCFIAQSLQRFIYVSVAPVLTGGRENRIFIHRSLADAVRFEIVGIEVHGRDIMSILRVRSSDVSVQEVAHA